ncbi:MAG: hypothetical protein MHMPM18_000925 [Marteilia pararefringens]
MIHCGRDWTKSAKKEFPLTLFSQMTKKEALNTRRLCLKFWDNFLRKAHLVDVITRQSDKIAVDHFSNCVGICDDFRTEYANDYGNKVKHLADYCRFSKILVLNSNSFTKMKREEFLHHKIDLKTHLMNVDSINRPENVQKVPRLESYINLFDDSQQKREVCCACGELFAKIDDSKFDNTIKVGSESCNPDQDCVEKKEKKIPLVKK